MTKYEYKCVRIKKNGLCKLIMNVCKKNVVLPREWAGIVVGIWSHHGMPRFECFSCSETAFVDYGGVVKVNGMVMGPLYNTSKFLTAILSPLQNRNGYSVSNSLQFSNKVSDIRINDDEVLVSFDVVSLFTAIPVNKACDYIKKKLEDDTSPFQDKSKHQ